MADSAATLLPRWRRAFGGSLLRRYVAIFVLVVTLPLLVYGLVSALFTYQDQRASLAVVQSAKADASAVRILQFLREIETQLGWLTTLPWTDSSTAQRRLDALRVLRLAPAVSDLVLLDGHGRERVAESRFDLARLESGADRSASPAFSGALANRVYFGDVYFRKGSEPFMTLAVAGQNADSGVAIAEVSLKYIWDVVSRIQIGRHGVAYLVDRGGRLIAHPDISLVLRNTDLSATVQAFDTRPPDAAAASVLRLQGTRGVPVLASSVMVAPVGWRVIVEQPQDEADEPMHAAIRNTLWAAAGSLLLAIAAAVWSALRMARPLRQLAVGAARIGAGRLVHRIDIRTGDELQQLGDQFNAMAGELQESYATLERKVDERTRELSEMSRAKSRLIAAASHDLRQPLHALNLLVAQLDCERDPAERDRLTRRVEAAIGVINDMFDSLLDVSRLDAGVVHPDVVPFPVQRLLDRMDVRFSAAARAKGLDLRIRPHPGWVASDPMLLERILGNLVGNAIRYTRRGAVLVGCRRSEGALVIGVWDTGIGIAADKLDQVFSEFYQVDAPEATRGEGLGLGLSIVARLAQLLGHAVRVHSAPGRGSCFGVTVPRARPGLDRAAEQQAPPGDLLAHRRVLVIDNSQQVLDSTVGLLAAWGCRAQGIRSPAEWVDDGQDPPDLVLADMHLDHGQNGVDFVLGLRRQTGIMVPAVIMTGDQSVATRDKVAGAGLPMLVKPVSALRLRTALTRLVQRG